MPNYLGVRRILKSAPGYPSKTFRPGVQQIFNTTFSQQIADASYTFLTGVTGGSPTIWYLDVAPGINIQPGDSFTFYDLSSNSYTFWFQVNGSGSGSGTQVTIDSTMTADEVCTAINNVNFVSGFFQTGGNQMTYITMTDGSASTPSSGNYGNVTTVNGGSSEPGTIGGVVFFTIVSIISNTGYYFWAAYSNGSDPGTQGGATNGIQVPLSGDYDATALAAAFANAINSSMAASYITASAAGPTLQLRAFSPGQTTPASSFGGVSVSVSQNSLGYGVQDWPSQPYVFWTNPDNNETYAIWNKSDPFIEDHGQEFLATTSDSDSQIASNMINAVNAFSAGFNVSGFAGFVEVIMPVIGPATSAVSVNPPFTVTQTQAGTSVFNLASDTMTLSGLHYPTGLGVKMTSNGSLPNPLVKGTTYYIIRVSANVYKFATSKANALAGTAIDLDSVAGVGAFIHIQPVT